MHEVEAGSSSGLGATSGTRSGLGSGMRDENGEKLLTIGQMARLNAVSEKALRVYQSKGILIPRHTDEQTGYRYYTLSQCASLDMIQQLRLLGFSLDQICEVLREKDVSRLRDQIREHVQDVERQRHELAMAHQVGADLLRSCEAYLNKPPFGQLMLQTIPERHVLEFELDRVESLPEKPGSESMREWELDLRAIRRTIIEHDWPISLFRNVGCVVDHEDLLARRILYGRAFVFVTPTFGDDIYGRARTIPASTCLVLYVDGVLTDDGRERETIDLIRMLDECDRMGLEPAGDYLGEIIADGPAFMFEGREMIYRMCLPVCLKGQPTWTMPGQHDVMSAWRAG